MEPSSKINQWFKRLNLRKTNLLMGVGLGLALILVAAGLSFWFLEKRATALPPPLQTQSSQQKRIATETQPNIKNQTPLFIGTPENAPLAWEQVLKEIYHTPNPAITPAVKDVPRYIKNAEVLPVVAPKTPKIAIVIDDVGVNVRLSHAAEEALPPEITFSYLPYGRATKELAQKARKNHREVMIHLPMEPLPRLEEPPINPGPNALYVEMDAAQIRENIAKNLMFLKTIAVGVNNHMGSHFTSNEAGMEIALKEISQEGLFFLDSLTTHKSAVKAAAKKVAPHMPLLVRDVFLDHYQTEEALKEALTTLEEEAKEKGHAIAIGHPHKRTLDVLQKWAPTLAEKGIALVPISHLLPLPQKHPSQLQTAGGHP